MFPNRWIGKDGPISCPPLPIRSLDLTPFNFLGDYLKSIMYQEQSTTPDDVRIRQIRLVQVFQSRYLCK